jgi:hypothetical protein
MNISRTLFVCLPDRGLAGCLFLFQQDGRYQVRLHVGDDSSCNFVVLVKGAFTTSPGWAPIL